MGARHDGAFVRQSGTGTKLMRRILYLEHNTDGTVGGSHLCLLEICRNLDRSRYQPVVCFFERNTLWDAFAQTGAELLLEPPPLAWRAPSGWPKAPARLLAVAVNLYRTLVRRVIHWRRLLRDARIDLVHLNNACGFDHDLMLACRLERIPCVVHERGIQRSIGMRTRYFANRADRLIAISDAVADNLRRYGVDAARILRINDGIDPERLVEHESAAAVRRRLGLAPDRPVIGIVGNIKPWKGQLIVMQALGRLLPEFPELHCLFVGSIADPEYAERMRRSAAEMSVPDAAYTFMGYEAHPTDLMRAMDIVIHASVDPEPFGIVLLEAMAVARPLIASAAGAPREIVINGQTGLLVKPGDPDALAAAVARLLADPQAAHELSEAGRLRFHDNYTTRHTLSALEGLYRELLPD